MYIEGNNTYKDKNFSFRLTERCKGYTHVYYSLNFNDRDGNYFEYEFNSLKDFKEQFKEQKTNLFKVFFNNNTIDVNSFNFDFTDTEYLDIFDEIRKDTPTFYEKFIEDSDGLYFVISNSINDNFYCDDEEYRTLINYIENIEYWITGEIGKEYLLEFLTSCFYPSIEELTIEEIFKFENEGIFKIMILNDKEEKLKDSVLNYYNKKFKALA